MNNYELIKQHYLKDPAVKFKAKDILKVLDALDPVDALNILNELRCIFEVKAG